MNTVLSIIEKQMCNMTHHKSFGTVLTAAYEVCKRVVLHLTEQLFSFVDGYTTYRGWFLTYISYQISLSSQCRGNPSQFNTITFLSCHIYLS